MNEPNSKKHRIDPEPQARPLEPEDRPARKPYRRPRLVDFGDVRATTLGTSPGIGDSANPSILRA